MIKVIDVTSHLPIPGHPCNILKGVDLVSRAHGARGTVQVPDKYLRLAGSGGKKVGLERVNVERSYGPNVLGVL